MNRAATVGIMDHTLIDDFYEQNLPFLSDLLTIENNYIAYYVPNLANDTDLTDVSVIITEVYNVDSHGRLPLHKELSKI